MSANYASGLSEYKHKGICGTKEFFDSDRKVQKSVNTLADWIRESQHCVVYCGAGISTAAGIPDFRGPNGIWTLEKRGQKPDESRMKSFDQCQPTFAHMALIAMTRKGLVKHIVSQNIDGLFVKANLDRQYLSELHGNYFVDKCDHCGHCFIRNRPSPTMGCKVTGDQCLDCTTGQLRDTILDWEQELPEDEFEMAEWHAKQCDLAICLGTSLQMQPANSLPLQVLDADQETQLENRSKHLVIVNLQRTKFDHHADMVIHHYIDKVMTLLAENLQLTVTSYDPAMDPTKHHDLTPWKRD